MFDLPFREVWALDFEFHTGSKSGALPVPVCMVARELQSGRLIRLWQDQLTARPPFPINDETLFVSYFASAETGCFLALGWPVPPRMLDLYVEFRNKTNGIPVPEGSGLLSALSYHQLAAITKAEKEGMRNLILSGGPWADQQKADILDYCQGDVDCLGPLLERMLPAIRARQHGLGQALLRGRYMNSVAAMERTGIPIDVDALDRIRNGWEDIKLDLIRVVDKDYGVFDGVTFKAGLFASWLAAEHIDWPRHETGNLMLDRDTFKEMARMHPRLELLKELRHSLSELRLEKLQVGPDGRNRALLSPFRARTGRNQPSNSKFIFGPSVWLRGLIRPEPGRALAYIDWSSQEVWIAAKLSGDQAMIDAVTSGDPYLTFAKMAGLAPSDATKQSHKEVRTLCKTCVLGTNYGMGAKSLARRTGISVIEAEDLLARLARAFPVFNAWAEQVINVANLKGYLSTVFGWNILVTGDSRPTALRNFPVQANAAEMLRLACCLATERGIEVCAPVHDAMLIEGDAASMAETVAAAREAMGEASRVILGGLEIGTDVDLVEHPARYQDPRGQVMWDRVNELLSKGARGSAG